MKRLILLCLVLVACHDPSNFDPDKIDIDTVIEIEGPADITADGASTIKIRGHIPEEADEEHKKIKFEISSGTLIDGLKSGTSLEVDIDGDTTRNGRNTRFAEVTLKSTTNNGSIIVQATITDFETRKTITLDRANPDSVSVATSRLGIARGFSEELTITAQIHRDTGIPTAGVAIEFSVRRADGQVISSTENFRASQTKTNSLGQATVIYSPGFLEFTGEVEVVATLKDFPGIAPAITTINIY